MTTTLTTADIGAFAAMKLRRVRDEADTDHHAAQLPVADDAARQQCARRISDLLDVAHSVYTLSNLAGEHGDFEVTKAIEADVDITANRLIEQAAACRTCSFAQVPA